MAPLSPEITLDADRAGDIAVFWRVPRYRGLEFLRATFRRYAYARHTHETYAIAAIIAGWRPSFIVARSVTRPRVPSRSSAPTSCTTARRTQAGLATGLFILQSL